MASYSNLELGETTLYHKVWLQESHQNQKRHRQFWKPGNGFSPLNPPLLILHGDILSALVHKCIYNTISYIYIYTDKLIHYAHGMYIINRKEHVTVRHRSSALRAQLGHPRDDGTAANAQGGVHAACGSSQWDSVEITVGWYGII